MIQLHSTREYANCEIEDRLCPRRCHWNGCQAILNSIYALKQHVRQHQSEVEPIGPAMTVSCQWKQCRMVCEQFSLLRHLDRHIERDIICVYDDCDERFSRIKDLEAHEKTEHANDEPPPCAIPRRPELMSLPGLSRSLPSYTATTRLASKPSITEERHARLGPWVNILSMFYSFHQADALSQGPGYDDWPPNLWARGGRAQLYTSRSAYYSTCRQSQ
ncbi:hypothetical protein BGW80DRAFT_778377 [Lactifluus volemus]|nr:hypothetical protein BGW80DRAFT_778377 [Lactifluus volemus]